jgi:Protein of unknown function (DUF3419)
MYEDRAIELEVLPARGRVFCIASAGCTAFELAARGDEVTAVDVNPAQVRYVQRRLGGELPVEGRVERLLRRARGLAPLLGWGAVSWSASAIWRMSRSRRASGGSSSRPVVSASPWESRSARWGCGSPTPATSWRRFPVGSTECSADGWNAASGFTPIATTRTRLSFYSAKEPARRSHGERRWRSSARTPPSTSRRALQGASTGSRSRTSWTAQPSRTPTGCSVPFAAPRRPEPCWCCAAWASRRGRRTTAGQRATAPSFGAASESNG